MPHVCNISTQNAKTELPTIKSKIPYTTQPIVYPVLAYYEPMQEYYRKCGEWFSWDSSVWRLVRQNLGVT